MNRRQWEDLRILESEDAYTNDKCSVCGESGAPSFTRFGPCGGIDSEIYPYHIVNKYSWTFCVKHHDTISKEDKDKFDDWLDDFENTLYLILSSADKDDRYEFYMTVVPMANRAVEAESNWRIKRLTEV